MQYGTRYNYKALCSLQAPGTEHSIIPASYDTAFVYKNAAILFNADAVTKHKQRGPQIKG
jgi:hypothetical protein